MKTAYTFGYAGRTLVSIQTLVEQLDAILVDIRFNPYSPRPEFRRSALAQVLAERYRWVQAFGNRNYKSGGPVDLVDYEAGKALLESLEKPALLMCACADYQHCHRRTVAERLRVDGFTVREWEDPEESAQPRLF